MKRTKRIAAILVAAGVLIACGSGGEPESTVITEPAAPETTAPPAVSTTPTLATSTTVQPTNTTLPTTGPVILESTLYPYALTVPAEELLAPFKPATVAWDGKSRVLRGDRFLDWFGLSDGGVYVVGVEWPDDVESLAQMYVDNYVKHHTCSQAKNQREVTVGGEPAVLFTVDSCGSANENLTFARLAVVHDGFGLIAFTETGSGEEAADMDRLFERFSGLEWRTG